MYDEFVFEIKLFSKDVKKRTWYQQMKSLQCTVCSVQWQFQANNNNIIWCRYFLASQSCVSQTAIFNMLGHLSYLSCWGPQQWGLVQSIFCWLHSNSMLFFFDFIEYSPIIQNALWPMTNYPKIFNTQIDINQIIILALWRKLLLPSSVRWKRYFWFL